MNKIFQHLVLSEQSFGYPLVESGILEDEICLLLYNDCVDFYKLYHKIQGEITFFGMFNGGRKKSFPLFDNVLDSVICISSKNSYLFQVEDCSSF